MRLTVVETRRWCKLLDHRARRTNGVRGDRSSCGRGRSSSAGPRSARGPCAPLPTGQAPTYGDADHTRKERGTSVTDLEQTHDHASRHDPVYDELEASPVFARLRSRYRRFAFPATVAFLAWYLLYVVLSSWAPGFMGTKVVGNINVALVFGLLQFATTFLIAWAYARYMDRNVDPLAREIEERYVAKVRGGVR